jgi:hypothetical protein
MGEDIISLLKEKIDKLETQLRSVEEKLQTHNLVHIEIAKEQAEIMEWRRRIEITLQELDANDKHIRASLHKLLGRTPDFAVQVSKDNAGPKRMMSDVVSEMYDFLSIFKKYPKEQISDYLDTATSMMNQWNVLKKWKVLHILIVLLILNLLSNLRINTDMFKIIFDHVLNIFGAKL